MMRHIPRNVEGGVGQQSRGSGLNYLDIFEAPDLETARVAALVRSYGHAHTGMGSHWWERCKELVRHLPAVIAYRPESG
jgi:hypothetical protein